MSHVPTVKEIQTRVAEFHGISPLEMKSARRAKAMARPRQIAMYLTRTLTHHSFPAIGREFGRRDHTSVMHACKVVKERMRRDASIAIAVEALSGELTRGPESTMARARAACRKRRKEIQEGIERLQGALRALERAEHALDKAAAIRWPSEERLTALLAEILDDE